MAPALDTTAHPSGNGNLFVTVNAAGGSAASLTTASFNTGAGPILLVAKLGLDGSGGQFPASIANTSGLTWLPRATQVEAANGFGAKIWTAFSALGSLTSQTVTATLSNATTGVSTFTLKVEVWAGVASTEAACIGNTGGWIDENGTTNNQIGTQTVVAQVTPAATGSVLTGVFGQANNTTVLAADSNTSAWDAQFTTTHSDNFAFGTYRVSGALATTTAGTPVTFGSSTTEQFGFSAALEIKGPAAVAPVGFYSETSRPLSPRAPRPPSDSFCPATASPIIIPPWGYDARSYEIRQRPRIRPPHESFFAPVAPVAAVTPPTWGYDALQAPRLPRPAPAQSGESRAPAFAYANLPYVFPLSVSANGRYLVDANGLPFPVLGDSAWEAVHNLTAGELEQLLDDRVSRGFTATLLTTIEHKFTSAKPPKDLAGNLPFTLRLDGGSWTGSPNGTTTTSGNGVSSNTGGNTYAADPYVTVGNESPDFTTPNATYWAKVDAWISLCALKGVACFVYPAYYGFNANDEGWNAEMVANDAITGAGGQTGQPFADASKSKLWNYGAWLADRYKNFGNIVWIMGGDSGLNGTSGAGTFSTAQSNAVLRVYQGMHSISAALSQQWCAHWGRNTLASDISADATNGTALAAALTLESTYPNTDSAQQGRAGYAHSPVQPVFDIEDTYEGDESPVNRRLHYWELLTGIAGYFWSAGVGTTGTPGSIAYWGFPVGWQNQLTTAGTLDVQRLNTFWQSIAWWRLVPSGLGAMKSLVTSGGGTASPQSTDYVSAAAIPDGTLLLAYRPPAHSGTITIDMTAMAGPTRSRWFDPTNGLYTADATGLAATGTHVFTVPGNNSAGATDWLLVLDAAPSLAWTPTQPDQLQPRRAIGPERPIATQAPVQPAAPVIQVQTSLPDRPSPVKLAPRPDQMLPVGPAAQVVPLGIGWAPEVPDIQAAKVPSPDRSASVLPPVQPSAGLPVLSTVTAPDQLARPPRAKAEIATAPTQPVPLAVQPQVTQTDVIQPRRPAFSEVATAPPQPASMVAPPISSMQAPPAARARARADVAQAPTQPIPPLPIQPQSAVHDAPLKPKPAARAETALAPFQPPPPPTWFAAVNSLPGRAARAIFDAVIRPIINFIVPVKPPILAIQDATPALVQAAQDPAPSTVILASQDLD